MLFQFAYMSSRSAFSTSASFQSVSDRGLVLRFFRHCRAVVVRHTVVNVFVLEETIKIVCSLEYIEISVEFATGSQETKDPIATTQIQRWLFEFDVLNGIAVKRLPECVFRTQPVYV